jgi:hypothetical protein
MSLKDIDARLEHSLPVLIKSWILLNIFCVFVFSPISTNCVDMPAPDPLIFLKNLPVVPSNLQVTDLFHWRAFSETLTLARFNAMFVYNENDVTLYCHYNNVKPFILNGFITLLHRDLCYKALYLYRNNEANLTVSVFNYLYNELAYYHGRYVIQ